jgi:CubicO group peptidase (beta-lactamase class C family)
MRTTCSRSIVITTLAVWCGMAGCAVASASSPAFVVEELSATADAMLGDALAAHRFPGAVVAFVHRGEIVFARGYGVGDVERDEAVDPAATLFSVASVTKLVTATAVMQQVERGLLDLHADVDRYTGFAVPRTHGAVSLAHLLTHTPGFEDRYIGMAVLDATRLPSLGDYLRDNMPTQIRAPGDVMMYSNHGFALAAHAVEQSSGMPFAEYVRHNIFAPLRMRHSRLLPDDPLPNSARISAGYAAGPGRHFPLPDVFLTIWPAGSMQATAEDMARFMIAHLGGADSQIRILDDATLSLMHARQFSHHERLAGWTYGFAEYTGGGPRAIFHDGDLPGFNSRLMLWPEFDLGFFVVNNGSDLPLRIELTDAIVAKLSPAAPDAEPLRATPASEGGRFAGNYRSARYPRTTADKLAGAPLEFRISELADGSLRLTPPPLPGIPADETRWSPVGPLLFRHAERDEFIAFREADDGTTFLFAPLFGIPWSYHAVGPLEALRVQLAFVLTVVPLLLSAVLGWPLAALVRRVRRRRASAAPIESRPEARRARAAAGLAAGMILLFLFGAALIIQQLSVGERAFAHVVFALPIAALIPMLIATAFLVSAWRDGYWRPAARLHYSAVILALLGMVPFLAYWNLLGFHF